ncbi:hypothetical protein [Aureimonas sp. AU4]|uniref:hypothetical protein n=1 Tax=Aureimonas sp. AU4 TaxID=1638163 RepID=UPI0007819E0D|nr:hypothetical protein [Aureimonas sp. AU4]
MARFDIPHADFGTALVAPMPIGETLMERGLAAAAGREGPVDLVSAHMYFNLADQLGAEDAAYHRAEIAASLTKVELGRALRQAREWLVRH